MLIDTHAHLNFQAFKDDVDEVIKRTLVNDVWVINIGSQYSTSKRAVEIAQKYQEGIFAAVGLHPIHLEARKVDPAEISGDTGFQTRVEEFDYEKYKELVRRGGGKVVAIGEIGLDYYWKPKTKKRLIEFKERQKKVFLQQLDLAQELNLPVIFHCRAAHEDLIEILNETMKQFNNVAIKGVVHCFTGNFEQAQKFLDLGLCLGFNGLIFKNVPALPNPIEIIQSIPLERILLETDSPYLVPLPVEVPQGGTEEGPKTTRNEPINVRYVAERIAQIKKVNYEKVAEITTQNAKTLFRN